MTELFNDKLINIGVIALLALSGLMSVILVRYINNTLTKIDDVGHIKPLLERVESLIEKVDKIFTTVEVTRSTTALEFSLLKDRVTKLEAHIERLLQERGN